LINWLGYARRIPIRFKTLTVKFLAMLKLIGLDAADGAAHPSPEGAPPASKRRQTLNPVKNTG